MLHPLCLPRMTHEVSVVRSQPVPRQVARLSQLFPITSTMKSNHHPKAIVTNLQCKTSGCQLPIQLVHLRLRLAILLR